MRRTLSSKNRRALSTVVTSAIIMSSMAVMGVALVGWSNANLLTKQNELESTFSTNINKLNENILVENIWFGTSPSIVNMTLNNVGSIGLNVTEIQIVNSTDTMILYITDGGMTPNGDYSIEETFNWNSGETTDFTIFTERGNIFTYQDVT